MSEIIELAQEAYSQALNIVLGSIVAGIGSAIIEMKNSSEDN